ncbi:MAG: hypothetical protein VB084_11355 [Syntrophomonadaceae bacterium]|nr:hypothetical protein [Syntrophomonadaceae bacterium]
MSIVGKVLKGSVALIADGLDWAVGKGVRKIGDTCGKPEIMETVAEIGSGTVRATEITVKTLADVVDGGLETGAGYLVKNKEKRDIGLNRMKTAGLDLATGMGKGLLCTYDAGSRTAGSAFKAGKYYVKGSKKQADREFARTKIYARDFGKLVLVGLLAVGPVNSDGQNKKEIEK